MVFDAIPCISSDCPTGPFDIIQNGKNGLLYECSNRVGLQNCLEKMYSQGVALNENEVKASVDKFYEESYFKLVDKVLL